MGVIEFNHWKLFKANITDFPHNDSMLEVRDKQYKIAFSIQYKDDNGIIWNAGNGYYPAAEVTIKGYFIGDTSIAIVNTKFSDTTSFKCIPKSDPKWKEKASVSISRIKSIFKSQL